MIGVKHTPWEVEDFGCPDYLDGIRSRYAVRNESGEPIAYAFDADEARMIAAAPCMFEALEEFSREYDGFEDGNGDPCPVLAKARAAIARARGEQDGGGE